jgi:hypothetical protein
MHVARIRSGYTDKQARRREYESAYLRRTYRDVGKVKHETLANLSGLGEQTVAGTSLSARTAATTGTATTRGGSSGRPATGGIHQPTAAPAGSSSQTPRHGREHRPRHGRPPCQESHSIPRPAEAHSG